MPPVVREALSGLEVSEAIYLAAVRFRGREMAPHGVRCRVAAWADTPSEAWQLENDGRSNLARALRAEGIAAHTRCHDLRAAPLSVAARARVVAD